MSWGGCALAECAVCGEVCERQGRVSYCEGCDPDGPAPWMVVAVATETRADVD